MGAFSGEFEIKDTVDGNCAMCNLLWFYCLALGFESAQVNSLKIRVSLCLEYCGCAAANEAGAHSGRAKSSVSDAVQMYQLHRSSRYRMQASVVGECNWSDVLWRRSTVRKRQAQRRLFKCY